MITLKQLEALYWIGRLGSFEAAARHLQTSQPTITRRIQEFETATKSVLFDRTTRVPTLTRRGQEAWTQAASILESTEKLVAGLSSADHMSHRVSIGVTELSAFSWTAGFMRAAKAKFPELQLDLRVGSAFQLRQMLLDNKLDMAVVPAALYPPGFTTRKVGTVPASFCGARARDRSKVELPEPWPADTPFIVQENALFDRVVARLVSEASPHAPHVIVADGLLAMIALAASDCGLTVLPDFILDTAPFSAVVERVSLRFAPDPLDYLAVYSERASSPAIHPLLDMVERECRFTQFFPGL